MKILLKLEAAFTDTQLGAERGSAGRSCNQSGRMANVTQRLSYLFTAQAEIMKTTCKG